MGGCIITVRVAKGIVLKKLPTGNWSGPLAIHLAGPGLGANIGIERSSFIMFLHSSDEVDDLVLGNGTFTIGLNGALCLGPVGAAGELETSAFGGARTVVGRSIGAFGGASIEFCSLFSNVVKNRLQYGDAASPEMVINGKVPRPTGAAFDEMYAAIKNAQL